MMTIARAVPMGLWAVLLVAGASLAAEPAPVVFEVDAGPYERRDTLVYDLVPESLKDAPGFALEDLDTHKPVPVQKMPFHVKDFDGVAWIIREPLPAGATRRYRLSASTHVADARPGGGVHAFVDGHPVEHRAGDLDGHKTGTLKVGDRPVLTYQFGVAEPPPGLARLFRRSGFIHPLQTPSGRVVTDDFARDHAHQHGLFFAWVNTTFEGRHVDFWNQEARTGSVSQVTPGKVYKNAIVGGPVFGELLVELEHEDLTAPGGPKPVLKEFWQVLVYDIPGHFVVDLISTQYAIDEKLTVNKYHYGGLGLRGSSHWFDPTVKGVAAPDPAKSGRSDFLTSDGKHRADGNHTRPRWVDLSGELDGQFAGVAIFDKPTNFRYPQPVRLHPNKPYFCFAPMVEGEFAITRGQPYVSNYRLYLHDGPPDREAIERAWHDFADPPRVRVVEETR